MGEMFTKQTASKGLISRIIYKELKKLSNKNNKIPTQLRSE